MKYSLYEIQQADKGKKKTAGAFRKLLRLVRKEKKRLFFALAAILVNSGLNLLGPLLIGYTIDNYVQTRQMHGVLVNSGILLLIYLVALAANYVQTQLMGSVGQEVLYNLRNLIFNKL